MHNTTEPTVLGLNASDWALLRVLRSLLTRTKESTRIEVMQDTEVCRAMYLAYKKSNVKEVEAALRASFRKETAAERELWEKHGKKWNELLYSDFPDVVPVEALLTSAMQNEE